MPSMAQQILPPNGVFLFPIIWRQDPTSSLLKTIILTATLVGLVFATFVTTIIVEFSGLDSNWDADHGITSVAVTGEKYNRLHWLLEIMFRMIEETMGVPSEVAHKVLGITVGFYVALIIGDCMLAGGGAPKNGRRQEVWPRHWDVDNTTCYEEMFSEPSRLGRLVRRPGNTLSNFLYLYCAFCILLSVLQMIVNPVVENIFIVADGLFGIMLLILSIASTTWHGSNAVNSHYIDLWSMDCCIVFLSIRYIGLGFVYLFIQVLGANAIAAKFVSGWMCAGIYTCVIFLQGRMYYGCWKKRWLHGHCPFSTRARLSNRSDIFGKGHIPISIAAACIFIGLPFFALVLPLTVQYFLVGSTGSIFALNATQLSFVIGWSYRIFERFALDGCIPMNFICRQSPSIMRTVGAALLSPTTVLHFSTGITLLMAYIHARSVEQYAF